MASNTPAPIWSNRRAWRSRERGAGRGANAGKQMRSIFFGRSGSPLSSFQTITQKADAHDGRSRVGTAQRIGAIQDGRLSLARCEPPPSRGLPASGMGGRLELDGGRRAGRLDWAAC